ncbi:EAL and HDOD domain-containing protein [Aestuariirhabdus litorea]|uniref:HDOD domain-containing protein n=1 Tax=Aestuariirhabdus litorea TaxID=2528527 RepID=A0A3P3VQB8_9GAMM|nr:HDOD domain-containing protein [Aestuariirhabdus litorea]RRJ84644.1 HDOD domain-containing protein [Aestuariirhabdus litorea]RWW97869.1 HDOD domain-containing protein [Endozoicomonadaceae bacterium GTF-13]
MDSSPTLLARQPIFDTQRQVHAYELLFRDSDSNSASLGPEDGDSATSTLFSNLFAGVGLEEMVGDAPAFINFTRTLLLQRINLDPDRYVIEILEGTEVDHELLEALVHYQKMGVKIALDDFVLTPDTEQLLPFADYVKVDVLAQTRDQIGQVVSLLSSYSVTLLAEKVENYQAFEFCRRLGFKLFQGYFLCKPENIKGKRLDSNRLIVFKLLELIQDPDVHFSQLSAVIDKDPNLSIKLIKLVNSAFYRRNRSIESIQQAVTMLGLGEIKTLATMLSLANLSDKPDALVVTALARANMMEQLGKSANLDPGPLFLAGILSLMDAFMDRLLPELIEGLSVSAEIKTALLEFKGDIGELLKACILFEQAHWQKINWERLDALGVQPESLRSAYLGGIRVARQVADQLHQT